MMKGIIYKATNTATGSTYIGATTRSLEDRKQDHIQKANNSSMKPFHEAISTFGEDAFTWKSIDTATTNNELAQKEVNYIYKFSKQTKLYNQTRGGEIPKEVYQYDAYTLKLVAKYPSLTAASKTVNTTKKALSRVCISVNQYLKGYYWSYRCSDYHLPNIDKRKKQVFQFTQDGNFVNSYKSIADANKQTNINKTSIAKVCRGERKTAGSCLWKYQ